MALVLSSPLFIPHHRQIAQLAVQYRLPTMFINRTYLDEGGLMSYGVNFSLMCRGAPDLWRKSSKARSPKTCE
jgi:hypothetical protein